MDDVFKKIEASFNRQGLMKTLGASLEKIESGTVQIAAAYSDNLSQQHNFFHAGVITALVDSACGYAALTLAPAGREVLTVEFKVNFLKPAATKRIIAVGRVIQSGKTLTVCEGDVYDEGGKNLIARMTATMILPASTG